MHRTTTRFWQLFEQSPQAVQAIARKNFELLKADPAHPWPHFKNAGNLWSVRAGINYRALAVQDGRETSSGCGSARMMRARDLLSGSSRPSDCYAW